MSVVLCLPAHLRVSTAASRGQALHGNASLPSTIQIQSTLLASFQYAGRLTVHTETRASGMYKNCTKNEALKLAYDHK